MSSSSNIFSKLRSCNFPNRKLSMEFLLNLILHAYILQPLFFSSALINCLYREYYEFNYPVIALKYLFQESVTDR